MSHIRIHYAEDAVVPTGWVQDAAAGDDDEADIVKLEVQFCLFLVCGSLACFACATDRACGCREEAP